jgi:hypothetical protein
MEHAPVIYSNNQMAETTSAGGIRRDYPKKPFFHLAGFRHFQSRRSLRKRRNGGIQTAVFFSSFSGGMAALRRHSAGLAGLARTGHEFGINSINYPWMGSEINSESPHS